jgi:hypothetical protein
MRLVPVTYRAKRIAGKLAWVNVYALVNVGQTAGTVIAGDAAVAGWEAGWRRPSHAPARGGRNDQLLPWPCVHWVLSWCHSRHMRSFTTQALVLAPRAPARSAKFPFRRWHQPLRMRLFGRCE